MKNIIKEHRIILILLFTIILLFLITMRIFFSQGRKDVLDTLNTMDLSRVDKLMIVAHPDDEMIWGGASLINEDYLVVCVTCGSRIDRKNEFERVLKETSDLGIELYYPDKIGGKRSDWNNVYNDITSDIEKIINYKDWSLIVTHNKDGEYGHIHHVMTHNIVKSVLNERQNFLVFNNYCTKDSLENNECIQEYSIDEETLKEKKRILYDYYKTQENTIKKFEHMLPYERFIEDDDE